MSHPRSRHLGLIAFSIILMVATLAMPLLAGASDYRTGRNVEIGATEHFAGNVYISASDLTFDGQAARDVNVLAGRADIGGTIGGSVNMLAGSADVTANVAASVHIAGGSVEVSGGIEGDLLIAGGQVTLAESGRVSGDVILAGGTVSIDGTVQGNVYGTALSFSHDGTIAGDVNVQVSDLTIESGATVGGDLRYQSPRDADIAQPAAVTGEVERTNSAPWEGVGDGALRPFGPLLRVAWALVLGAAIVALLPRLANRVAEHAASFMQPAAIGLVSLVVIPLVAIIALVTIVGIPLGLLTLVGFWLALYLSQIFVGLTIGRYVLPRSWRDGSRGFSLLAMTLGVVAIGVLRMVPLPFVGAAVAFIVAIWGLGALLLLLTDLTPLRTREVAA